MYKSVKITEESYKKALLLRDELEKTSDLARMGGINLSTAIGYAVAKMLERKKTRERMRSSAGGWSDVETGTLLDDIYRSRLKSARG